MSLKHPSYRWLTRLVLHLVGLGLLGRVLWINRVSVAALFEQKPDGWYLTLAFVICLSALVLTFIRWLIVVRAQGLTLRLLDAIRVGFIGNAIDLVIPGQIGGDVFKANFLCRTQEWKVRAVASIFVDRALGLLGLFTLATLMGILNWTSAPPLVRRLILLTGVVWMAGAIGFSAILTPSLFSRFVGHFQGRARLSLLLSELEAMSLAYRDRKFVVGIGLILSTMSHALYAISFYVVGLALVTDHTSLVKTMLMVPLVLFTTVVPLPFGALGLSEQVSQDLFHLLGNSHGAITMLSFRVVSMAVTCVSITVYIRSYRKAVPEQSSCEVA